MKPEVKNKKTAVKKPSKPSKPAKPAVKKPKKVVVDLSAPLMTAKPNVKPIDPQEAFKAAAHPVGTISTAELLTKKQKNKRPAVVKTPLGLGLVYEHEPKVNVTRNFETTVKTIVHLVKDNMEPRMWNGEPKKALVSSDKIEIIKPAEDEKPVRAARKVRVAGEPTNKDFTKYKFQGEVYGKGRMIHATIVKYVADNNPTMIELLSAFPQDSIKAPGKGLIVSHEDAEKVFEETKRHRFFTKKEDVIKIKGGKICVSNQITAELAERFVSVAVKFYKITKVVEAETAETATHVVEPQTETI
jgi:hypothetical protein